MGLTLFIYPEQRTPDGWRLPLGMMPNPEWVEHPSANIRHIAASL